ncbi:uncharacterized protein C6orf118-like [Asterias amurensis]|uniref:uncharacterized protein C6orf118-like n=1 Tax=Asterias amurensis TaxID=7602 RepID=UPI003AB6D145
MEKVQERPLHDLLEGIFQEQKHDIDLMTRGHLNHNRLWKPPDKATHIPWESSGKEIPLMHQPSKLPSPRLSTEHHDEMTDAMYNFGIGTSGSIHVPQQNVPKSLGNVQKRRKSPPQTKPLSRERKSPTDQRPNTVASYISDNVFVEEMRLPELMLPITSSQGTRPKYPHRTGSPKSLAPLEMKKDDGSNLQRHQFIESHLGGVTKKEQFQRFVDFQTNVMKRPDMLEQNVLAGRKQVQHLEKKLETDLMSLDEVHRLSGPNFHRLQIYSNIWEELMTVTPTFGDLLAGIKNEYEVYMGSLLDTQPQKHSQVLVQQVESLASGTPIAPGEVSHAQEEVKLLEKKAKDLLQENDRLRKKVRDEQETLDNLPPPEPESKTQKSLRAARHHHRDDKPKGIEDQILELHVGILAQMDELQNLRSELNENYVPASVCQHLDQCVRDTEADVLKVLSTNEYLEKTIQQLEADLEKLMHKSNADSNESRKIWKSINMLSAGTSLGDD